MGTFISLVGRYVPVLCAHTYRNVEAEKAAANDGDGRDNVYLRNMSVESRDVRL